MNRSLMSQWLWRDGMEKGDQNCLLAPLLAISESRAWGKAKCLLALVAGVCGVCVWENNWKAETWAGQQDGFRLPQQLCGQPYWPPLRLGSLSLQQESYTPPSSTTGTDKEKHSREKGSGASECRPNPVQGYVKRIQNSQPKRTP